ncbi:MAG: hypothetical protein AAB262_05765, partial [Elusimicrobiota bacterium]
MLDTFTGGVNLRRERIVKAAPRFEQGGELFGGVVAGQQWASGAGSASQQFVSFGAQADDEATAF